MPRSQAASGLSTACGRCVGWHPLCYRVMEEVVMHASRLIAAAALSLGVISCDDTGKAIKEEVKEIDKQEVKQDLKAAASAVGSAAEKVEQKVDEVAPKVIEGVKDAAKKTEKAIDKVDKKAAEEIRRD
jgi:hypothetical protein